MKKHILAIAIILTFLVSSATGGEFDTPEQNISNERPPPVVIVEQPEESNTKWLVGVIAVPIIAALIPILILRKKKR